MKRIALLLTLLFAVLMANAQNTVYITANGQTKAITLSDNVATRQWKALLEAGPMTVRMRDYGGFEKVGALPQTLPSEDRQISTVCGDVMLYQGNSIVIFYGENAWAYTPLGKIDGTAAEIKDFLSGNSLDVTFSMGQVTAVEDLKKPHNGQPSEVYDLQGHRIRLNGAPLSSLPPGIYIVDGEKRIVR